MSQPWALSACPSVPSSLALPDPRYLGPGPRGGMGGRLRQWPLSQSTHPPLQALTNSTIEYENLESEVSALHDDLWEQLNLDVQVKKAPGQGRGGWHAFPSP